MKREQFEAKYGRVSKLTEDCEVHSFRATHYIVTTCEEDMETVELIIQFSAMPRYYFDFKEIK